MTLLQLLLTCVIDVFLVTVLAGLLVRARHASCFTFTAYLVVVALADLAMVFWPSRFLKWDFWLLKEAALNLLKFAIALELGVKTFRAFPGARATARRLLFLVLVLTGAAMFTVPPLEDPYLRLAGDMHARILNGTVWMFTAMAALILWYRLPVAALHKAIVLGFVPYLLVFTVAMSLLRHYGWEANEMVAYLHMSAYLILLIYWSLVAWKPNATGGQEKRGLAAEPPTA